MWIKNFLVCIIGAVLFGIFFQFMRSLFYFLDDSAPEMGVVYPVILSPIITIPLGLIGFAAGLLGCLLFGVSVKLRQWFIVGALSATPLPLVYLINLLRQ